MGEELHRCTDNGGRVEERMLEEPLHHGIANLYIFGFAPGLNLDNYANHKNLALFVFALRFPHGTTAGGASHSCSEELVERYRMLCCRIGFERKGERGWCWEMLLQRHHDEMLDDQCWNWLELRSEAFRPLVGDASFCNISEAKT